MLVADCYAFIFVDRQQGLKRHLQDKSDLDGLVRLNIRHFLHERQKAHDPLGFRIFELLQNAVEDALASGALHVLAGDRKIRNDTLLGFHPEASLLPTPADWDRIVLRWNDELMPGLVTARTRQQALVVRQLRERLLELPGQGIETFRFKDLLDPLKRDVRERWATLLGSEGPALEAVQTPSPGPAGGDAEPQPPSLEDLTRHVSTSIDRMEADPQTRAQLTTLWRHLWQQHEEEAGRDEPSQAKPAKRPASYRQLGQCLNISRERLPALFALLRQLVPRSAES